MPSKMITVEKFKQTISWSEKHGWHRKAGNAIEQLSCIEEKVLDQDFHCAICNLRWTHLSVGKFVCPSNPVGTYATKDHIVPRSKFGDNTRKNIQAVCYKCNQLKGSSPFRTHKEILNYNALTVIDQLMAWALDSKVSTYKMLKLYIKNEQLLSSIKINLSDDEQLLLSEFNRFVANDRKDKIDKIICTIESSMMDFL